MRIALPCIALAGSLLLASCTGKASGTADGQSAAPLQPVTTTATRDGGVEVTIGKEPRVAFVLPAEWQAVPWRPGGPESVPEYHAMLRHRPTSAELVFFGSFHETPREAVRWYQRLLPEQRHKTAEGVRSQGPRWVQYAITAQGKRNLVLTLVQGNFVASANSLMKEGAPAEAVQAAEKALEGVRDTFRIEGAPAAPGGTR